MLLIDKLVSLADAFRSSRKVSEDLSLDDMIEMAAEPSGSGGSGTVEELPKAEEVEF